MEKLVLYVPNLESQFYYKKEFQESITPLSCTSTRTINHIIYEPVERKLYFRSVAFGMMEFQFVMLDFRHNKIVFMRNRVCPRDVNEWLSSLQLNFEPRKMSFVMERPKRNYAFQ
ncbi:hypothetical protein I2483_05775 [Sporosarcina sp. E16_3]|uniref:hypothetical protein n=1 Tax=Sporosarcina sp. E16_3 TaxID=2789293 RepID=UPI001A926FBA|nr:hypothetical protein [Sporosarcina sp. E16_3]MBO0601163.1 hypothetical protein [Sporosarcina sp. E16_3]